MPQQQRYRVIARFEHRLLARKAALHKVVARRHRRGFVAVEQRASFVARALGLSD
jgi:hypothetical protein